MRDAKYCLGYAYFDMPDLKPARRWHRQMFPDRGLVYPWVQDMRALAPDAAGKQHWIRILKQNHASASDAAEAKFRDLSGEAQRNARNEFYGERKKKLRKILTKEQWAIWSSFWSRGRPAPSKEKASANRGDR